MTSLLSKSTISVIAGFFLVLAAVSAGKADTRTQVRQSCGQDIQQYCQSAIGGGKEKMRNCVRDNASQFSEPCRAALKDAWQVRRQQNDKAPAAQTDAE